MRKFLLLLTLLVQGCFTLYAQDVVCDTFHFATHDNQELYLDRYTLNQSTETPRPCMIYAFGGGFVQGVRNHEYYNTYFERLAREGIVVVSIDYRLGLKGLTPSSGVTAMIEAFQNAINIAVDDMYAATNYIVANAEEWHVDKSKIMISGSSAGAITALQAEWIRCNGGERAKVLPEDFRYAAVVSCAGAIFSIEGKPKFNTPPAPMLLFHGTSDSNVPYDHSAMFGVGFFGSAYIVKQLDKLTSPYWFYSVEYADHKIAGTPLVYNCDVILQFINDFVLRGERLQMRTDVVDLNGEKRPTRFKVMDYIKTNYARKQTK
ncbi:MAG: alpha/beta hydrolase [Alistipes sp.]|nr:alpha/beta hydrolase [Alistipes sp.]